MYSDIDSCTMESKTDELAADSPWCALYTRHQHEKSVTRILESKGFETFLPLYSSVRVWKDRRRLASLPLFPCYVFIRGELRRSLEVLKTPGVHAFVLRAGQPVPIPAGEMDAIRRSIASEIPMEPHPFLKTGDWVQVKAGPLVGIEGILVQKKGLWRLVLSVEMLGKAAAVEIDATQVEKIKKPHELNDFSALLPASDISLSAEHR
jgi:transcription antitermination factor NusG